MGSSPSELNLFLTFFLDKLFLISLVNNAWCINFTVDEGGSAEPTRDKKNHRHVPQEGIQPPSLLCDPGWIVLAK